MPFPYRPGMTMRSGTAQYQSSGSATFQTLYTSIPGIVSINWIPSVGYSEDAGSPISLAAREIYAKVRDAFSGTLQVDAPDFVIYLVALDSIFSAIGAMKRLFRVTNTFSPENYITPEGVLRILGADPSGWRANRMDAFQNINELALRASKFVCPRLMDYFNRHYWMNDNVYTDAPDANSQFYVFKQTQFWKFSLQDTPDNVQAGGLELVTIDFSTPASSYSGISQLLNALASSEDAYTISGYLMRAFNDQPSFVVDQVQLTELMTPVYVEEVLSQIENSMSLPGGFSPIYGVISQDPKTNAIISTPKVQAASNITILPNNLNPMISLRGSTSAAEVTIATRLKTTLLFDENTPIISGDTVPIVSGSEIVVEYTLGEYYRRGLTGPDTWETFDFNSFMSFANTGNNAGAATTSVFWALLSSKISQFDWSPFLFGYNKDNYPDTLMVVGDMHNTTVVTNEMLSNLNRICLYSEFNAFGIY